MTTPLYIIFRKRIDDKTEKLIREQITPWVFLNAGTPLRITTFTGEKISYSGIKFEGSPRTVYWSRYIEPFLEDICITEIRNTVSMASEKGIDFRILAPEIQGLLSACFRKVYQKMADVDRRLRGEGFPDKVEPKIVENEISMMNQFLEERIQSELAMWKPKSSFQIWYERNPALVWLIVTILSVPAVIISLISLLT